MMEEELCKKSKPKTLWHKKNKRRMTVILYSFVHKENDDRREVLRNDQEGAEKLEK